MSSNVSIGAILIVEDADTCRETLEVALEGARPGRASRRLRGGGAPHSARGRTECPRHRYDLNMPAMDGLELIRQVRADRSTAGIPIIVVSGEADLRAPARALGAGADAYSQSPTLPQGSAETGAAPRCKTTSGTVGAAAGDKPRSWRSSVLYAHCGSTPGLRRSEGDLERLRRLEESNRALIAEVASLKSELAATRGAAPTVPPVEETLSVLERRVEEQAQSKVESSQRFPIRVTEWLCLTRS